MKEFYIFGRPIKTRIGNLHFLTVSEYYDFVMNGYMEALVLNKQDLLKRLKQISSFDENINVIIDVLSRTNLFDFLNIVYEFDVNSEIEDNYVRGLGLVDLYNTFVKMFEFCFKEDVFHRIADNDEFEMYRDMILEINNFPIEKPNPNPEIERFNQLRRLVQKSKGESVTFEAMYTSVGLAFGKDPDDMTLYKFYKYFDRLSQFKNYDTTTLFATVSSDVKIEPWFKSFEEKKNEMQTISEEELFAKAKTSKENKEELK